MALRVFTRWFAGSLLVLLLLAPASPSLAQEKSYSPMIVIGAKSGWKNILTLFWSHDDPRSGQLFQLVRSFQREISNKSLVVVLYQSASDTDVSLRQAAVFLCAPQDNYGLLVTGYLDTLAVRTKSLSDKEFQSVIRSIAADKRFPKAFSECVGSKDDERAAIVRAHRDTLLKETMGPAPSLYLNGRLVIARSAGEIRKLFLKK